MADINQIEALNSPPAPADDFVSVVIPVYNRLELLSRTLESVFEQTYKNMEVLVVDDASSVDVKGFLGRYEDARVRYLRHDRNRGVAAAWNTGIAACSGRFLAFLGSDDEWSRTKVEKQVAKLGEARGTVCYCLSEIYSDSESRVLEKRTFCAEGDILHQVLLSCMIGMNSMMARREDVVAVGPFDERMRMHSDWDFLIRLAARYRFSCVREVLNRDHWHDRSQITKGYLQVPTYDNMILERNRALFDADRKAHANFLRNLAYYEGLGGRKVEAMKSIVRSLSLDPFDPSPYIESVLLLANKLEAPSIHNHQTHARTEDTR